MTLRIGTREIGDGHPCYIVGEIGINHNGSTETALRLIDACAAAGMDAVKFQKRTVDLVYTPDELAKPRESIFGDTNGDLKRGLELDRNAYDAIDRRCKKLGIAWFASCWDAPSIEFIARYEPPCWKVASAMLTDHEHLRTLAATDIPILLSTGGSTFAQVAQAQDVVCDARRGEPGGVLLHAVSTYPCPLENLNLARIGALRGLFGERWEIGYSGHEVPVGPAVRAESKYGACVVERHVTLDRAMWGSDQPASLEPPGFTLLVRDIRNGETSDGDGADALQPGEAETMAKLRRST